MTTSTSRTPSRNDIFSTSWSSSDSLVPAPPVQAVSDLIRRRTTGQAWRRPRTIPPRADSIFPSPEPAPKIHFVQQTAGSVREPPELRLRIELADTDITPSPQSSRTSSFFDVSPSTGLSPARHPASPYSTQSISTTSLTGTGSSTNPSLAASLPSPPPTKPLTPIQLRFSPRPELKLGQGRFSQVYLAACRELGVLEGGGWRVCVVKRLEADEDSQALGVREAWFLNQLRGGGGLGGEERGKEYITRLLGVEVEEKEASIHVASRLGSKLTAHLSHYRKPLSLSGMHTPTHARSPILPPISSGALSNPLTVNDISPLHRPPTPPHPHEPSSSSNTTHSHSPPSSPRTRTSSHPTPSPASHPNSHLPSHTATQKASSTQTSNQPTSYSQPHPRSPSAWQTLARPCTSRLSRLEHCRRTRRGWGRCRILRRSSLDPRRARLGSQRTCLAQA